MRSLGLSVDRAAVLTALAASNRSPQGRIQAALKQRRTNMNNTENTTATKSPAYIAYQVREGNQKGYFTRVGAAWPNKDGKGFNIQLDAIPLDGRITLRVASEQKN
jgi:hypothetical protein